MAFFKEVEGEAAIVIQNGVYKQVPLYTRGQTGDKYENWSWLPVVTQPLQQHKPPRALYSAYGEPPAPRQPDKPRRQFRPARASSDQS